MRHPGHQPTGQTTPGTLARIFFAGGGTAGHVFPGIAVAQELGRPILWIGSTSGVERRFIEEAGIEFRGIPAGKLRRYLSLKNVSDVLKTIAGIAASIRLMRREKPALLFSKGGFVSVPPVLAAWLCGIPSWTHESDFDPGLATRINLRFSERVLVSFPETVEYLPARYRGKAIVTGNPVRPALYHADPERGRAFVGCGVGVPLLLVLGGSLASTAVSRLVTGSLAQLRAFCFVVHQTGSGQGEGPAQGPAHTQAQDRYLPIPFIGAELPDVMAAADLVVSRAGANTLSELAVLGKASILIPLPQTVSRGDQVRNAEVFRAAGASVVLREEDTTPQALASTACSLLEDSARLQRMRAAARTLAAERPAALIAKLLLQRLA